MENNERRGPSRWTIARRKRTKLEQHVEETHGEHPSSDEEELPVGETDPPSNLVLGSLSPASSSASLPLRADNASTSQVQESFSFPSLSDNLSFHEDHGDASVSQVQDFSATLQSTTSCSSSDEDDENDEDFEMCFLEEQPLQNIQYPEDPDDPDEPDDSSGPDSDEEDSFSFDDRALDTPIELGRRRSRRDILLLNLVNSIKHNWTYEALVHSLASWNIGLGRAGIVPDTKKQLWSILSKTDAGLCKHAYCNYCQKYLGKLRRLKRQGNIAHCIPCNQDIPVDRVKWFVSVSLKNQLQHFLATPGIGALLNYRNRREKHQENGLEDIYDGDVYRGLLENGTISPTDFTYVFNTDAFPLFKQRSISVTGMLIRVNELLPSLRQRHLFLAGIWVDNQEPNMNTFLKPFVSQANKLSRDGIFWNIDGQNEVCSKFLPICCCVDAVARCKVMNQAQFNGFYGCTFCTHRGIHLAGSHKYPVLPFQDLPPAVDRTHESINIAMHRNEFFEGQKGPSEVMLLNGFDMGKGNGLDDLHPYYEGVAAFFLDLLVSQLGENEAETLAVINHRMKNVRTPTQMARKWKGIEKRSEWKGSQHGYFIKYFAVICFMENHLTRAKYEHLSMLSYALFVLSRDSVLEEELERCTDYLRRFVQLFQQYYGVENMRYNVHLLSHAVQSVRNWGPTWTISTFNFESWNRKLGLSVTSPKGVVDQIVHRHLLKVYVHSAVYREDVAQDVRSHMAETLFSSPLKISEDIGNNVYVLGHPTLRLATPEEREILLERGFDVAELRQYQRVLVRGIEYRCRSYNPDTKSDNSIAYTWNNKFVIIDKIIVIREEDRNLCGMFVEDHQFNNPIRFAPHIAMLTGHRVVRFISTDSLRVPAIKMIVQDRAYVVPMSSCREID